MFENKQPQDRCVVVIFRPRHFCTTFAPSVLYVPDTHVALQAWGEPGDVDALTDGSVDVYSMG
tara:strand:- start:365 stop:553 length:189 start_codon:yes stop_codon:yes gene_type:complete